MLVSSHCGKEGAVVWPTVGVGTGNLDSEARVSVAALLSWAATWGCFPGLSVSRCARLHNGEMVGMCALGMV